MNTRLQDTLGLDCPIIQAPMAGTSTPAMAVAVCEAGGLGSVSVGAAGAAAAPQTIAQVRSGTSRPFNVNVFCTQPPVRDARREAAWIARLKPRFEQYNAQPPTGLREIYKSFLEDDAMLEVLLRARPRVVSFHFGLPSTERIEALRSAGIMLWATATSVAEARRIAEAKVDVIVAQGYEAGGHRGIFDADARDDRLGTLALTRLLAREQTLPVIAAGGIMDGAGVAAAMALGASAAQLGTAFVLCPESSADEGFRTALLNAGASHTVVTRAISGRPARCLANRFTALGAEVDAREIPAYPVAYDAGKALHAGAKAAGDYGYGAQWAGQGAALARALPAGELVQKIRDELASAL